MDSYNIGTVRQYREVDGKMLGRVHGDTNRTYERVRGRGRKMETDSS